MPIDPVTKKKLSDGWRALNIGRTVCPGCGASAPEREINELDEQLVMLVCVFCGHVHLFDLDKLKARLGIR